ncbi:MAG: ankyrin repeat domain 28, partial [Pseudomonadota bacterium]
LPTVSIEGDLVRAGFFIPPHANTTVTLADAVAVRELFRNYPDWRGDHPWPDILNEGHSAQCFFGCIALMRLGMIDGPVNEVDLNCKLWLRKFILHATEPDFASMPGAISIASRLEYLINAGAEIDDPKFIWDAAIARSATTLPALIRLGADVHAEDDESHTALHRACAESNPDALERLILVGGDIGRHSSDPDIGTPLMVACSLGDKFMATVLIDNGANLHDGPNGQTPLHKAAAMGHLTTMELLLSEYANPNCTSADGNTPFHELSDLGCADPYDTIELLSRWGASPNMLNSAGNTPLHVYSGNGDTDCLLALLSCPDVTIDAQNNAGQTALHIAARRGFYEICQALLSEGANPAIPDLTGATAVSQATDAVRPLLTHQPETALSSNGRG